jgi:hypothetical protein
VRKFNNGTPYCGSKDVVHGKLKGATAEGDYFYFFCPKCKDDEIMRLIEYGVHAQEEENPYNDRCKSKAKCGFTLVFKLHCEKCGFSDFVKVSNTGWQGGKHKVALREQVSS